MLYRRIWLEGRAWKKVELNNISETDIEQRKWEYDFLIFISIDCSCLSQREAFVCRLPLALSPSYIIAVSTYWTMLTAVTLHMNMENMSNQLWIFADTLSCFLVSNKIASGGPMLRNCADACLHTKRWISIGDHVMFRFWLFTRHNTRTLKRIFKVIFDHKSLDFKSITTRLHV